MDRHNPSANAPARTRPSASPGSPSREQLHRRAVWFSHVCAGSAVLLAGDLEGVCPGAAAGVRPKDAHASPHQGWLFVCRSPAGRIVDDLTLASDLVDGPVEWVAHCSDEADRPHDQEQRTRALATSRCLLDHALDRRRSASTTTTTAPATMSAPSSAPSATWSARAPPSSTSAGRVNAHPPTTIPGNAARSPITAASTRRDSEGQPQRRHRDAQPIPRGTGRGRTVSAAA